MNTLTRTEEHQTRPRTQKAFHSTKLLVGSYAGISTLVINYRNQAGGLVCEVLHFDGPLVREGHGTYLVPEA